MMSQPVTPTRDCVVRERGESPSSLTPHPVVLPRSCLGPIEFEDSTLVSGGYLKTPVRVVVERQGLHRFVLMSKCDWVFHVATGYSRPRTAISVARTFDRLRVAAVAILENGQRMSKEVEVVDPMLALSRASCDSASARSRSARPRQSCAALLLGVVDVLAADVAPFTLAEAAILSTISVYVVHRARTTPYVDTVIGFVRHELSA